MGFKRNKFLNQLNNVDKIIGTDKLVKNFEIFLTVIGFSMLVFGIKKFNPRLTILGIFLVILSLTINVKKYELVDKVMHGNGYRLGDMVKSERFRSQINGRNFHYKFYPNSIASEYMKLTKKDFDYDILNFVIKRKKIDSYPDKDELIVHLRTGDDINRLNSSVDDILLGNYEKDPVMKNLEETSSCKLRKDLIRTKKFFEDLKIPDDIKKITLISNPMAGGRTLRTDNINKSVEYVKRISEILKNRKFDVQNRNDKKADDDLIYMTHSKYFSPSHGGFSKIVRDLVIKNNGVIIE